MRLSPLYNLKQGINRLRIKGGANPSSLYDLVNGWITIDGSINPREGTIRAQMLNSTTKGLMADDGVFNVFSITQVAVPSGYQDNILINPNDASQAIKTIWFAKPFMGFPYVVAEFVNGDVFHYWLQNSGTWAPNTVYNTGTLILPLTTPTGLAYLAQRVSAVNPLWQPETGITLNTIVEPTEYTGYQYKAVAVAGASPHTGQSEPVWPIVSAGTIQEFGDFDTSSTDAGTTQGTTPSTAQPLSTTITDRYGDSSTIASAGASAGGTLNLPPAASTKVTTWKKGTLYAPGAVVQPSTSQGAFLNAIPNGDFESGNDGNWILTGGVSFNSANEYQGTECLQFTASHSNETATMNTFGLVTPGQSVTASVYVNPNNSGANLGMGISLRWYDASDSFLSSINGPVQENGGYRLTSVTGTAPSGAAHVRVQLFGGNGTSAHTGFADLVSWNLATPTAVSNFLFEAVQATAGASGSTEPTWPTVAGNTVVDNQVTWKAIGTSIITWEAIPIMQSGASEPVWPTVVPNAVHDTSSFTDLNGAVIDTSISWIASSRRITDIKDPNTVAVALNSSHVFAVDKDIVPFSAAVDPTDWSSTNNAGYLPTGLNNYGDNPAAVLALYRSNLMVFNAGGYQMWQTDPDPANMAILDAQPVGSIYTRAAQSVANDLLFLTEVGVRNLATVGATANMQVGSSGQPIDPLIKSQLSGISIYQTPNKNVQTFLNAGAFTWVKPSPPSGKSIIGYTVSVLGAGAGGGVGIATTTNNPATSALGGPGGGFASASYDPGAFPATVSGTVGAGGVASTGQTAIALGGNLSALGPVTGGASSFGAFISATGGQSTGLGGVGTVSSGTPILVQNGANSPPGASGQNKAGTQSGSSGASGGSGGLSSATVPENGGNSFQGAGGGTTVIDTPLIAGDGSSGAGGGAYGQFFAFPSSVSGGQGGDASFPGQGGGASGNADNPNAIAGQTATAQRGGNGAPGLVIVTTLFTPSPVQTIYQPLSLYYPGKGQYWLLFGPQAFVFTVNGQGLRTWSRYIFPDVITDWTLNGGVLYLRTAGDLVWQFDADTLVDDSGGNNVAFKGVIQTPYVDVGPLGLDKELVGVDIVGTGSCTLQVGWAQNDTTTFSDNPEFAASANVTPPFAVSAADTVPGEPIPMPMTAPSFTVIITFDGNQAWEWQASNLYLSDVTGTPTG